MCPRYGKGCELLFPFGTTVASPRAAKDSGVRKEHSLSSTATKADHPITLGQKVALAGLISNRRATILLVDGHESARSSLQRVLRNSGFRVLTASTGKRALKIFSDHSAEVDLLIADEMMPGMSGRELARTLCTQKPELRVMITSGLQEAPPGDGAFALIRKPFDSQAIAEKISGVLDSRRRMPC